MAAVCAEWIVLLEAADTEGSAAIGLDALQRLMGLFSGDQPAGLFNAHRYALQVSVRAEHAADALVGAVGRWRQAVHELELPEWTLCRTEVMTRAEFDRELRLADMGEWEGGMPAGTAEGGTDVQRADDLLHDAFHDSVTGLPNRELFREQVRLVLADRAATGGTAALLVVDIDAFDDLNTLLGHAQADQVLAQVARRLYQADAGIEAVARLQGNRFAILVAGDAARDGARVAEHALWSLRKPMEIAGQTIEVTASVGLTGSADRLDADELVQEATAAMRAAKDAGGDRLVRFDAGIESHLRPVERDEDQPLDRLSHVLLLQQAAMAANNCEDVHEAYELVLRQVCAHTGWPIGHLYLVSEDGSELVPAGVDHVIAIDHYADLGTASAGAPYHKGRGVPGRVLATGAAAWSLDLDLECSSEVAILADKAGVSFTVAFPVLVGDEVAGVMEFFGTRPRTPDGPLVEVMTSVGAQLGRVVERERARTALASSELRFRALAESASDAIVTIDEQMNICSWNEAATRIFGYTEAEVLDQGVGMLMLAEEHEHATYERLCAMAVEGSAGRSGELTQRRRDGSTFPAEASFSTWEADGKRFFTAIIRDVTARHQAEADLRAGAARLRALMENSTDSVSLLAADGTVREHFEQRAFLGYEPGENAGRDGFGFLHPDDAKIAIAAFHDLVAHPGVSKPYELRVRAADGSWRWVESVGNNLLGHPDVRAMVVTSRDVTSRHRDQETLAMNDTRRRALMRGLGEDTLVVAPDGAVLTVLGGPHVEGTSPSHVADILDPADVERLLAVVAECATEPGRRSGPVSARLAGTGEGLTWMLVNLSDEPVVGGVVLKGRQPEPM